MDIAVIITFQDLQQIFDTFFASVSKKKEFPGRVPMSISVAVKNLIHGRYDLLMI